MHLQRIELTALLLGLAFGPLPGCGESGAREKRRVILLLVDGFRADMMNPTDAPHMWALARQGVRFKRHHSVFPCTTLTNAGAIATGSYPQKSSWWGEKLYAPTAAGNYASGGVIDFKQHVDVRDWGILKAVDEAYNGQLETAPTLFKTAKAEGLRTAILGKPGATFLQDMDFATYFIDTDTAAPRAFARELQAMGYLLPPLTPVTFPGSPDEGGIQLPDDYVNPYAPVPPKLLEDGITPNPSDRDSRTSQTEAYGYFVEQFVNFILPEKRPDLSFLWLNEPDATMHTYGPGSPQYRAAIRAVDRWVGRVVARVNELGLGGTTDIIVTADHGATTISGDLESFPLRLIKSAAVGGADAANGWSVSGQAMLVEPLRRGGFNAFNGRGCVLDPLMTGMKADGSVLYPTQIDPMRCEGKKFTSTGSLLPAPDGMPGDAVLIMETAGGDFIYVPSHNGELVGRLVRFLQERSEVGAIFVNGDYGAFPGAMMMDDVFLQNNKVRSRAPDIAFSYWTDEKAQVFGVPGIGYHNKPTAKAQRGDHGSLAPQDVDIPGFALGPDFRAGFEDEIPTANVDIAPTIAHLLGLDSASFVDTADGRVLFEAFRPGGQAKGVPESSYVVQSSVLRPAEAATGLAIRKPTSPDGSDVDPTRTSYTMELQVTDVAVAGREKPIRYVDSAHGIRN